MHVIEHRFSGDGVDFLIEPSVDFPLTSFAVALASPTLRVLESLWFEERLQEVSGRWRLPTEEVYRLDPSEAAALGLPSQVVPLEIELRTVGYAGAADFKINGSFGVKDVAGVISLEREGPIAIVNGRRYLVPLSMLPLFDLLDSGPPSGAVDQLLYLADVKRAATACGARVDRYIEDQDVETPSGIGVEVRVEGPDRLRIAAYPEGVKGEYRRFGEGPIRSTYTCVEGTRRRRLLLRPTERQLANRLKERSEIRGADVPKFLANPEAFIPDGIDLSRFSLRVRGLVPRRYSSQPYVRLQPTDKRDWFALDVSVELEDDFFDENGASSKDEDKTGVRRPRVEGGGSDDAVSEGVPSPQISPEEYAELCRQVLRTGERFVLHDGSWIEIAPDSAAKFLKAWNSAEVGENGVRRIAHDRVRLVLDVISNLEELEFVDEGGFESVLPDLPDYEFPNSLQAKLLPHQEVGYRWLRFLHERKLGGLLADDMGLGKTVQVISFLAHLADAGELQPALIVAPLTLMENWKRELARFCPRIRRVYEHQGTNRLRHAAAIQEWEVVLTTYETLRRDQLVLGEIDWSVIACDEAQKVKNPTAQATSAVKGMKAGLRLAITGTPVENGLSELWCIVDWVQPGKLGSQREFRNNFERPMQAAVGNQRLDLGRRLRNELTPHYIRRVKDDVLSGLPPRTDKVWKVDLGQRQRRLYVEVVRRVKSGEMIPIEGLQHLLAIASHPELYEPSDRAVEELIGECPKLGRTLDLLAEIRDGGEKAVVFTRFRRMQHILQEAVARRYGVHAAILNGEVTGGRRQALVDRFNATPGFGVLLLSPEAAGVGLNIVGANHVIHYTRLWNPAKENQATDRVHRLGQKLPVTVHFPIVGGGEVESVEERLHRLLEEKRALAQDVVRPRETLSVEKEMLGMFEEADA